MAGVFSPAIAVEKSDFHLKILSADAQHVSSSAALRLAKVAADNKLKLEVNFSTISETRSESGSKTNKQQVDITLANPQKYSADLLVVPLRSLATQVPALEVLELPFFFSDIDAVHKALDGKLGKLLREHTRQKGWELLSLWDEGMHALSGNRRYDRVINLTGMEFILLRTDPVAEKQFKIFDAWTRSARPQTREQLLRECMIGSRSASLQQIWHERLDRVHLDVSLTKHRYEALVLIAPLASWKKHNKNKRASLLKSLAAMKSWQRTDAQRRENEALQKLTASGMQVNNLTVKERAAFLKRLPAWRALLSDRLTSAQKQTLLSTATGVGSGLTSNKVSPNTQPETPAR